MGFTGSFGFGLSYPWTLPTSVWDIRGTFGLIYAYVSGGGEGGEVPGGTFEQDR